MHKLKQSKSKNFHQVRLYTENIEEIWNLLENNCEEVTVHAGGYEISSIKEFKQLKFPIKTFNIQCHRPYLSLEINSSNVRLYISEDEEKTLGIFEKIRDILHKSQSNLRFLSNSYFWTITCIFFVSLDSILDIPKVPLLIFGIFILIAFISSVYLDLYRKGYILPENKNFFSYKKHDLIIAIIAAAIGSIITVILTTLIPNIFPKNNNDVCIEEKVTLQKPLNIKEK